MNDLQLSIQIALPDDVYHLEFYIHNKGQMYLPKKDGAFGSFYFNKKHTYPSHTAGSSLGVHKHLWCSNYVS